MGHFFPKKLLTITIITVFLISIFSWGIISGEGDDAADTSVTIVKRLTLAIDPLSIVFDRETEVGGGDYGAVTRGSTEVYAHKFITATVESDVEYQLTVEGTQMVHESDDPLAPSDPVIPVGEIEFEYDGVWTALTGGADEVTQDIDTTAEAENMREHDVGFRLNEIPEDVLLDDYTGTLTFDINAFGG